MIHALAREVAAGRRGVVIASSDDAELCDTCDRVLVMRDGRFVGELAGARLTVEELGRLQLGMVARTRSISGTASPSDSVGDVLTRD